MEARHCLSAANVIFGQTGKIPATEDSKFVCAFHHTVSHYDDLGLSFLRTAMTSVYHTWLLYNYRSV